MSFFAGWGKLWSKLALILSGLLAAISASTSSHSVNIDNQASASYVDSSTGTATSKSSNLVNVVSVAAVPPTIAFYRNPSFDSRAQGSRIGRPLFVQADAPTCNLFSTVAETKILKILSEKTGDIETFIATESAQDSAKFQILPNAPTRDSFSNPIVHGNGWIEASKNDRLTASIEGCGATQTTTIILIDPAGTVFDSRTNVAVAGARVELIDIPGAGNGGNAGAAARVFDFDGTTPAPSNVVTGADGRFEFPLVSPSSYALRVTPPSGYSFASTLTQFPVDFARTIDPNGSYGRSFVVGLAGGAILLDVPVDPSAAPTGLFAQKSASQNIIELGESLDFTVRVKNPSADVTLLNIHVDDVLPAGFAYLPGTARSGRTKVADPQGGRGRKLSFTLGSLAPDEEKSITYRVRTGPGATQGDGVNRAQAFAGGIASNIASAKVKVLGGVFSDRGFIVGKVYLDCNRNRVQDAQELGVPGVRIYLEDGTYIVSDVEGKYSFYGLAPRTHVLKVDSTTLPRGAKMSALDNRHAGDGNSRFVDLKNGELHKANFAEFSCAASVLEEVKARRAKNDPFVAEVDRSIKTKVTADGKPEPISDVKALPATGVIGDPNRESAIPSFSPVLPAQIYSDDHPQLPNAAASAPSAIPPAADLEKRLIKLDATLGFIDLKDKDTLPFAQTNIRVKGAAGTQFKLRVNGEEIAEKRVGKKSTTADKQAWEYVGVNLKPGANTLELTQVDSFGTKRGATTLTLIAPDKLGKLEIVLPRKAAVADGVTPVKFNVRLTDAHGVPVTVRTPVTLEANLGRFDIDDLNKFEPGVQVFVEGGHGEFAILPPQEPGQATLHAISGVMKSEVELDFLPDLRPMIAVGVIEGTLNLRKLNTKSLVPARKQDGFEQELQALSYESDNGRRRAAARAALFLKGKIKGEYLLTLGYDSDKETRERLFRDIQPDEFYPVYGDSAIRGFDAQSTSRLYVRVDKNKSYLLYGDYTTHVATDARKLSNYSRSLTGIKEHYENDRVSVNAFASRDSTRQVVDEIRANGTSGPYELTTPDAIANSEKVEIITRDRNQPAVVLQTEAQTRFSDYEIESLTGRILFKAPVPSLDANLNPRSIRITYEVDQGGKEFWVSGVDAQVKINKRLEVGASFVDDQNPQDKTQVKGVSATLKLGENTYVTGELAQSDKDSLGKGDGMRVELKHEGEKLRANLYAGKTDEEFDNPGALLSRGRSEQGMKLSYQLNETTRVVGEALRTEDVATEGKRDGVYVGVERSFENGVRAEVGVRHSKETVVPAQATSAGSTPNEVDSVRLKLSTQVPNLPQASVYGEYEQDIRDSDKRVLAAGGEYQIASQTKAYARHEFISSLSGNFALTDNQRQHTTIFGLDTAYMKDGQLFSEYRMRDALSGREAEAAVGLRNLWNVGRGIRLNTNFERVHALAGDDQNESTAAAIGVEYVGSEWWKGSTRLELRDGSASDSALGTLGFAAKVNRDWTVLARETIAITQTEGQGGGDKVQNRMQFGVAYRDTDTDRVHALAKIENRSEKDDTQAGISLRKSTNIFSMHGNYQPVRRLTLSSRYAGKWVRDESNGLKTKYNAHLVSGRVTVDVTERWDLSVHASTHFSDGFKTQQYGLGAEVGYLLTSNLWLSGGYNFFGYEDEELTDVDYTNQGWFARLRYKFDETLFQGKDTQLSRSTPTKAN